MTTTTPVLLKPSAVAALLGVSRGHLANLRSAGLGLPFVKIGVAVRYKEADVLAYIEANTVQPQAVA